MQLCQGTPAGGGISGDAGPATDHPRAAVLGVFVYARGRIYRITCAVDTAGKVSVCSRACHMRCHSQQGVCPMFWVIRWTDLLSGEDRSIVVEAESIVEAKRMALRRNIPVVV